MWNSYNASSLSKKFPSADPEQPSMGQPSISQMDLESWALSREAKSPVIFTLKKKQTIITESAWNRPN